MPVDDVLATVRQRVTPSAAERKRLRTVVDDLLTRTETAVADLGYEATVRHVGSTARGTWLPGERDVDIFVLFPPDLSRAELTDRGIAVGHRVLPDGHEEYAEHPYVTGSVEGFDVDLVPCYAVSAASEGLSAVDRTPFHTDYLADRLDDTTAGEVRVAKQFLTAIGAYGSDLRTRGFSGYLVELLVLECGTFHRLVEDAADWQPPVRIDPAGHSDAQFENPLVVIDPTDPGRNVAAALDETNLARFQHYARRFLADPHPSRFESTAPAPVDAEAVRAAFERRATTPVAIRFPAPGVVEDQLYPQLDRSLASLTDELDRHGFDVVRSARFADEDAVLLVECEVGERPAIERHEGPPVAVREHAEEFYRTYDGADVTGPYLDGDRYVVERERPYRQPADFLESDAIFDVGLGPDVADALRTDYEVLVGPAVGSLATAFGTELARYLEPRP